MGCGPLDWNACLQEIKEAVGSALTCIPMMNGSAPFRTT